MSFTFAAIAKTPSKQVIYTVAITELSPTDIFDFVDTKKFTQLCKSGCINYNKKWACPPHAPSFIDYTSKWSQLYLFFFKIDLEKFSYIKNDYLKIKAANSILKSRSDKYLRDIASKHGAYISSGSCRLCKPCKLKSGEVCFHPDTMSYSFEALGLDVSETVRKCFNTELLWYTPKRPPEYTSVVCGLLTNESISNIYLESQYRQIIQN